MHVLGLRPCLTGASRPEMPNMSEMMSPRAPRQSRKKAEKTLLTQCTLKTPKTLSHHMTSLEVEPLKQALVASRDVTISTQNCGSKSRKVFHIR